MENNSSNFIFYTMIQGSESCFFLRHSHEVGTPCTLAQYNTRRFRCLKLYIKTKKLYFFISKILVRFSQTNLKNLCENRAIQILRNTLIGGGGHQFCNKVLRQDWVGGQGVNNHVLHNTIVKKRTVELLEILTFSIFFTGI